MSTELPTEKGGLPIIAFETPADCREWFEHNAATSTGFWLRRAKKGNPAPSITYAEAVDVALCYGWIDGQASRLDDLWSLQRFTPRTKRSVWSQINREKVARLIDEGLMRPAGWAAVEAARADGRWDRAYPPSSRATVPDDFQQALDACPPAAEFFASLNRGQRYPFLYRLHSVKLPETRNRLVAQYVELLSQQQTLDQLIRPKDES